MKHRIIVALFAALAALGLTAPAAVAGNGTSNFYYSGTIGINSICGTGTWAALDWTNYDNGSNQTYHVHYRSSGAGIGLNGVYIDGTLRTTANEAYLGKTGWGPHNLKFSAHCPYGSPIMSGTVYR